MAEAGLAAVDDHPGEEEPPLSNEPHDDGQPAISKSQMKKQKRRQLTKERAAAKKEAEKAARKEAQEAKYARFKEVLTSMTEEELAAWREQRAARVNERRGARDAKRAKLAAALQGGQRIVLDLGFADLMTDSELRSLCQQLSYCYSANIRAPHPAHLVLTGLGGAMGQVLRQQVQGVANWAVTMTDAPYTEHFAGSLDKLVYLSADSPNELQALDPGKAYIVGGIVDRNRHKNLCQAKAAEQGVATARLPIGEYMQLASSQVLCTNHVVEIMLQWAALKDWGEAFRAVIPSRKRKADAVPGAGGGQPGEGEDGDEGCDGCDGSGGDGDEGHGSGAGGSGIGALEAEKAGTDAN